MRVRFDSDVDNDHAMEETMPTTDSDEHGPASPRAVVERFYEAFSGKDGRAMAALYAPSARFSDPVFVDLDGAAAGAMWRMLTRAKTLTIEHAITDVGVDGDGEVVRATWRARYPAPGTGRPVDNHITATIRVRDGQIVEHRDVFDPTRWTRMAFGPVASVPGMSTVLLGLTRAMAGRRLRAFAARRAATER
jgi:ketosteroid isomerase-like protein